MLRANATFIGKEVKLHRKSGGGIRSSLDSSSVSIGVRKKRMGDYAIFSLMLVVGTLEVGEEKRADSFTHADEIAKPYYYKVKPGNGATTEIAPTERAGHLWFSFPKGADAFLVLNGYTKTSDVTIHPKERKITGWVRNGTFISPTFCCYFEMQFDQPFVAYGTWENRKNAVNAANLSDSGNGKGLMYNSGRVRWCRSRLFLLISAPNRQPVLCNRN